MFSCADEKAGTDIYHAEAGETLYMHSFGGNSVVGGKWLRLLRSMAPM